MEYFYGSGTSSMDGGSTVDGASNTPSSAPLDPEERNTCVQGLFEALKHNRSDIIVTLLKTVSTSHPAELLGILSEMHPHDGGPDSANTTSQATLLHLASIEKKIDVVRALLNSGADPSIKDTSGKTAFEVTNGDEGIVAAYMLDFLQSISSSNLQKVQSMIDAGVDVNSADVALPIQYAACFGTAEIVDVLVNAGANVNATDKQGSTALHDAAQQGDVAIIKVLIAAGASTTHKGTKGKVKDKTPIEVAAHTDPEKLAEIKTLLGGAVTLTAPTTPTATSPTSPTPSEPEHQPPSLQQPPEPEPSIQTNLDSRLKFLWPVPQQMVQLERDYIQLPKYPAVWVQGFGTEASNPGLMVVSERLRYEINSLGFKSVRVSAHDGQRAHITVRLNPSLVTKAQSYRLSIDDLGVSIVAGDVQGLHFAVTTLVQILRLFDISVTSNPDEDDVDMIGLPQIKITDWPALSVRGFVLDVSRNKVPMLKTLFDLVDRLVLFKYNQFQLCFENTFAYTKHSVVWAGTDAYKGNEILHLDEYCKRRGIELVPHQTSFGNFEKWLKHPSYNKLAEMPDAVRGDTTGRAFSLDPSNRNTLRLLQDLYGELLPHFLNSAYFHVGFGDMDDFGLGRSGKVCEHYGKDAVFLDYLFKVRQLAMMHGKTAMIWGDVIHKMPEYMVYEMNEDVVVCERGTEDDHPFDANCQRLSNAAVPFFVCPGTSSWNSFGGRTANLLQNIKNAVASGVKHGAIGMLLTDWGGLGHLQPLCCSFPSIVIGGLSWNPSPEQLKDLPESTVEDWTNEWGQSDVARLLDVYMFSDVTGTLGDIVCELGNTYLHTGGGQEGNTDGTALFDILVFPNRHTPLLRKGITVAGLHAAAKHVKRCLNTLVTNVEIDVSLTEVVDSLKTMGQLAILACHLGQLLLKNDKPISELPITHRTDLANRLMQLIEKLEAAWKRENRASGLAISVADLEHTISCLLKDVTPSDK